MALCPFATQRPISTDFVADTPMAAWNRMNVHITAGFGSPWGFFSSPGKASSHFFVYLNGVIEQFQDTAHRAEGDLDGNDATISVENEGTNGPLTPEQVAANAHLFAWLRATHGIANQIATNSQTGATSKGLSWHRLGIDGKFPALPSNKAGRIQRGGGMHYSTSTGKACPTDAVIDQIQTIFELSQDPGAIVTGIPGGGVVVVNNPLPPVTPPPVVVPPAGPVVIEKGVPAPAYPLPWGYYFGPKAGPMQSVSGYYSHREDFRRWQQRMQDRGWVITPDGLYGPQSAGVAHDFQAEKGLQVDALVGPATWAAAWTADITR